MNLLPIAILTAGMAVIGAAQISNHDWHSDPLHGNIIRDVDVLRDLQEGRVATAQDKLAKDAIECTFELLAKLDFTTNSETLLAQPGLRAAAKFWGHKTLPNDFVLTSDVQYSNRVYQSLAILSDKMTELRKKGP